MTHRTPSGRRGSCRSVLWGVVVLAAGAAGAAPSDDAPALRLVPKPAEGTAERRPRPQPTVPSGAKEIPFDETAPEPVLTAAETERGYVVFQRPLVESVYPNTRPLPHERLDVLVAFAAPGEFEPVTFALYPARPLRNLRVRVSPLSCAAGVRTYATKDPVGTDAADYAPYLDIWCSQPYSVPYKRIVAQDRHEYWCYPNHNAGEIKDRRTMCKGGRMTYGFGLWRSGYTTLIPWHWCWTAGPEQFDYLRGRHSGCGQRIDDDGGVIPAVYWSCFREGYDDARYVYTLQQAIAQRDGSTDPACAAAVEQGRRLLQDTWDAIRVQPKYLADGMWRSEEFDAMRWRLAAQTARLFEFPAAKKATAPSVLVADPSGTASPAEPSPYEIARRAGTLQSLDLGGGFSGWKSGTAEGKTEVSDAAGRDGKLGLRWTIAVDHLNDGGEGGKYPIGWPRVGRDFKPGELDLSRYDALEFWIRIDSNRDEVADDRTPTGLSISFHSNSRARYNTSVDLGGQQRVWIPVRFPVRQMMAAADVGQAPWKSVSRVQLHVSEHDYAHGTQLALDVGEAALVRFAAPCIAGIDAPRHVLLPCRTLIFDFGALGTDGVAQGTHTTAALVDAEGTVRAEARQELVAPRTIALPLPALRPGEYTLRLAIRDAAGKSCSEAARPVALHAGPLAAP